MNKRIDRIKSARSLAEVADVVSDIAYEFKNSAAVVKRIVSSLSGEIVMDIRRQGKEHSVKDTKFVAPSPQVLRKHIEVINRLYDNVLELDAAEAMIKQSFASNKKTPAVLKSIKELKADIDAAIQDAFDALSAIASKHVPTKMATFVDGLTSHIIDVLPPKNYKDIFREVYVTIDPNDSSLFHFCDYIGLDKLKNQQGFTYDRYYIIVTGVVDKAGQMHLYVNGLPDFKIPGRYPLGKEVSSIAEGRRQVDLLLAHNNFVVEHERLPLGLDTHRANTAGIPSIRGVDSVKVEDDELIVFLSPSVRTEKAAEDIAIDIRARLNSIVGLKKNNQIFQHKFVHRGDKRAIRFILVPNVGKSVNLSIQRLQEVSELLGLSDKQQAALRFALQH